MARPRPRGCWAGDLPALLLLLLLRPPETPGSTCSTPTSIEHAQIRVKSYSENSRERYTCNSGFKRKAGTSSLTKCLRNEVTNITQWTVPSLKCIRDPSLTQQRPSSTVAPAGVTPEPESPSPSGQEPALTSKSDSTLATRPATVPGYRLMPSEPPPAGSTGVVRNEPSPGPAQTTSEALERTPSPSPGARSYRSRPVAVAMYTLGAALCAVCVVLLVMYYRRSRQTSRTPASVEMENMENTPMAGGTSGREDSENQHMA